MMKTRITDFFYLRLFVLTVLAATGGAVNIALNKPAIQISEEGSGNYPASRAVNGVKTARDSNGMNDYSQTGNGDNVRWWKVDLERDYLIKNVIIYNRLDCCSDFLSNFFIITSNEDSPSEPSPVSDDWIIRHYKHGWSGVFSNEENFNLYTTDTVRHVAIYLHHSEPLTLREVEVHNYSHSADAPVNQIVSGTAAKFSGTVTSPVAAVDGNTNMFSASFTTVNSQSSWVVKLKQSCGSFCYVRVYPRLVEDQFYPAVFTKLSRLQTLTYQGQTLPDENADLWRDNCDIYEFPQKGPLLQICEATAIWFVRLVNFGQGQIQFTEVQVFSREPAEFQNIKLLNQNYGCVNISTSPATADRATSYRFKCAGKDWSDRSSSSSLQSCGHEPGSTVTCEVVAVGEGGVNQSQSASVNLADCQAPSNASFTVRDIGTNAEKSSRKIKISNIMVEHIRCNKLISLVISVNEKNGGNVRNITRTANLYQDETIGDLKAYTDYTVYITAINNRYKISSRNMEVKTGELTPWSAPARIGLDLFNSTCGLLTWDKPLQPNGVILYYQVMCNNGGNEIEESLTADVEQYQFCGLKSASLAGCSVRANNTIGWSPPGTDQGYTTPELKDPLQLPELKPATDSIDIHISAVTFTNNETVIKYYQILVEIVRGNVVSTKNRRSSDDSQVDVDFLYNSTTAQTLNLTYYIAARLYNQAGDLISFTCGDNQTYGGYYNQPLETGVSYKIHYTYSVMLGERLITYLYISPQVLTLSVTSTVPPSGSFELIYLTALVMLLLIPAAGNIYVRMKRRRNNAQSTSTGEDNTATRARVKAEQTGNSVDSRHEQQTYENIPGPNPRPQSADVYSEIADPHPSTANIYMKMTDRDDNDHLYSKKVVEYENRLTSPQYFNTEDIQLEVVSGRGERCSVEVDQPEYEDVSNMVSGPAQSSKSRDIVGVHVDFATDVKKMNQKLYDYRSNPYDSSIFREFLDISEQVRNLSPNYLAGNKHCNVVKNGDRTILPAEYYRVKLSRGSDNYINAITVGSFENRTEFIVTQTPLENTMVDFWLMVHEQRIVNIVQLETTEVRFLPDSNGESQSFGNLTIRRSGTRHIDNVEIIQIEISPPHVNNGAQLSGEIAVFRYTDWNDGDVPDKQSLISLHLIIKQEVMHNCNSSTVVMCRDGGSKCGVYVNMFNILKKLEVVQLVDVYESVLQSRSRRPQFIDNIGSYIHLYEIVKLFTALHPQRVN